LVAGRWLIRATRHRALARITEGMWHVAATSLIDQAARRGGTGQGHSSDGARRRERRQSAAQPDLVVATAQRKKCAGGRQRYPDDQRDLPPGHAALVAGR
jgi:hypothetical protein